MNNNNLHAFKYVEHETFVVIATSREHAMIQCANSYVNAMCESNNTSHDELKMKNEYFVEYFIDHFVSCTYVERFSSEHNRINIKTYIDGQILNTFLMIENDETFCIRF